MLPKKRNKNRRKRITAAVVICGVLAVIAVFAAGIWKQQRNASHTEAGGASVSSEDDANESITYNGKEYVYNDHLSNYLFMGIDTRGDMEEAGSGDVGQADAVFLASMNRVTKEVNVISIPRDTMTEIEVFSVGGKSLGLMENHINLQYAQGDGKRESCELMETAVSSLLGEIPIHGYFSINMDAIPIMTEAVGNIQVVIPDNSLSEINPEFAEGAEVTLTKDNVEQFVRYRNIGREQSALVRQDRQKIFIEAYMKKAQEQYAKDASFVTGLYESMKPYMVTNIGNDLFVKLLSVAQEGKSSVHTLPGEGAQGDYFDEYHVDEEALQEMIISVFYREDN